MADLDRLNRQLRSAKREGFQARVDELEAQIKAAKPAKKTTKKAPAKKTAAKK